MSKEYFYRKIVFLTFSIRKYSKFEFLHKTDTDGFTYYFMKMMDQNSTTHCRELLQVIDSMENGLRASVEDISESHLNHQFSSHKMTIGQLAVHTMSWPRYFLSKTPPWEEMEWTCRPCEYPLTLRFVENVISDGVSAMRTFLNNADDKNLEIDEKGEKGKGYILYRLQLHTLVHANQIAYLRSMLDPSWEFGGNFGDMATAIISMKYGTSRDLNIGGF